MDTEVRGVGGISAPATSPPRAWSSAKALPLETPSAYATTSRRTSSGSTVTAKEWTAGPSVEGGRLFERRSDSSPGAEGMLAVQAWILGG